MTHLLILPILIPLLAAAACMAAPAGGLTFQRVISMGTVLALLVISVTLLMSAGTGEITVYAIGSWRAPFGIVLMLDRLSAIMVTLTAVLALPALLYAMGDIDSKGRLFHPLFLFQLAGINGAFLTGDIFNLFVFFEILLIASYGLLAYGGGRPRARAGLVYVVLNVTGSALFLMALALIYGTLGTLNIADIAQALPAALPYDESLVRAALTLLLVVFAMKAALVPLSFWLPHAYSSAVAPAAALFAILTKVGLYAILRTSTLVLPSATYTEGLLQPWLIPISVLTIALGAIGALAAKRLAVLASYLIILSTGTVMMIIAIPSVQGSAAAIYYMIHSTLVTAGLLLLADTIARQRGEHTDHFERGARMRDMTLIGAIFMILAIAVSGMPPLSGFFGKLMLMRSVQLSDAAVTVWTALLLSSLVVGLVLARAASIIFWEPKPDEPEPRLPPPNWFRRWALFIIVAASPIITVASGPIATYAHAAAEQLSERRAYVDTVLGTSQAVERERKPRQ